SVLVAFARSHGDLFHSEVNILDPEAYSLHDSQAAAVKQFGNELRRAAHQGDDRSHFFPRHHHWNIDLSVSSNRVDVSLHRKLQDPLVEEDERIHRKVLGGG